MKVIVAGSRTITDREFVERAIDDSEFDITEIVTGGASGVESLAQVVAVDNNMARSIFIPDWKKYGKSAGPIRNKKMANYADALIAVWDKKSRGTKNMIETMQNLKKPVEIIVKIP